ncbi:uncharacterized protein NECHADRAFT_36703 [Fusarium vanettenii 77-13-4]|uniref:Uncharacterized protein n=1 Tax=Fusarium vanettenii (strain ATCC MYA-4622 / CBS 123669 / FGSC 9596 / NRRL 45880 / 77-13-4) TaxID=660122 RepID=C7YL38_FUSV7|nr:uncharacterized protein NECHADRAFT_36703 [Fusarium vanettenii 77-13-4]EEU47188.1 hypothetical protein NECHADRAFT_36703 [Fusarium vanettenii 77-13-4]
MEESAPKRRRTSPRTSLEIGGTPPSPEPASPRRRRPSYASPTKASLARHNPEVLERRRSRSPEKAANPTLPSLDFGVEQSPSEVLAARLAGSRLVSDAPTPTRLNEATPGSGRSLRRVGGSLGAPARRTPSKLNPRPAPAPGPEDEDFNPFRGKMLRRSPPAGTSMPADEPPASMPEPELPSIDASSPPQPPASMPEPEFPSTDIPFSEPEAGTPRSPEEPLAPDVPTVPAELSPPRSPVESPPPVESRSPSESPPGPLPEPDSPSQFLDQTSPSPEDDSPSRVLEQASSSPQPIPASMPQPELPLMVQPDSQEAAPSASQPVPKLPPSARDAALRKSFRNSPIRFRELSQPRDSPLAKPPSRLLDKPRKSFQRAGASARITEHRPPVEANAPETRKPRPFDPDSAKKAERDALLNEMEKLKRDLETAQKENERIRVMQQSGRVLAPSNQEAVVDLIQRQHLSEADKDQPVSQQLVRAALNPTALLPFGKAIAPTPSAPVEDKQAEIKSHHPVSLTAEEELAYLELFTPFSISSNIAVMPVEADQPLKQLHSITFRSREIPGVFTARMDMVVSATNLTILDLNMTALEPASKPELGPFVEKICTGDCNRSMQQNVGILSWAMGEWLRVAVDRAELWCQLEHSLGSKDGVSEATSQMRARKSRRRKGDEEDEDSGFTPVESVDKADLIRYMGQQYFDISIPQNDTDDSVVVVRLEWKTEFDWTGEAESKLAVLTGVPGKWHQMDERGSLGKIPKIFSELVHGGEKPETAIRTIVALVAGEQS